MKKLKIEFASEGKGERARLFPVLSENSKEGRASSVFLATLRAVPEFANALLRPIGRPVGKRTKLTCRTEVSLKSNKELRPDGLLVIDTGHSYWTALLEFKVAGTLNSEQIEKYLRLARENKIDALITVSNDIVQSPDICPVKVDGRLTKSVDLFHFSWMHIYTCAELILSKDGVSDTDQKMLLEEFGRFLTHKSTGISGYESMPKEWPDVSRAIRAKEQLGKKDAGACAVASGWCQEEKELGFIMSRNTGRHCEVKVPRTQHGDMQARVDHHLNQLISDGVLQSSIYVPNAAGTIDVELDIRSRHVVISMKVKAPTDKKRPSASINWLLRQLPQSAEAMTLRVNWPGRAHQTSAQIADVRQDCSGLLMEDGKKMPTGFEIAKVLDIGAGFDSRKKVIQQLEASFTEFYSEVAEHIRSFVAAAPKSREVEAIETVVAESRSMQDELEAALADSLFED